MTETALLFRDDPYLSTAEVAVVGLTDEGGILLDRTIFYATGGGQPGDKDKLERADGTLIEIDTAIYGASKSEIVHVPVAGSVLPEIGEKLVAHVDWPTRHRYMRIHTALHLLTVAVPFPVSGGRIGADEGHLDFDIDGPVPAKDEIDARLAAMIAADHPVTTEWITDDELLANPGLVKTMSVKPPMGSGRVRLVRIGDIDLQPCGGTHVQATAEIGPVTVAKIENKGKQNRRIRIRFA
ncbi:alanyl-tRNA editing protein [Mesorhizobium sp. BR1-1-16]|uniref:alanyl-tRNA editing protein n=1 Tax=Mesorhizobium sp. BR1-1-16 TaxID=2876653 RepID=UPI001CCECF1B|nr:alanyl-tRNA editing protein [Mesorhizobium sp. BR1-1-16]MBZ9938184.1 alanyl-tRNA editing protein [Mesorhizobium sp. BR1-1-16]